MTDEELRNMQPHEAVHVKTVIQQNESEEEKILKLIVLRVVGGWIYLMDSHRLFVPEQEQIEVPYPLSVQADLNEAKS